MPRIDRGTVGKGLFLISGVVEQILEFSVGVYGPEVKLTDGVADAIAAIAGAMVSQVLEDWS